ncbi:unnamed protein product [Rotaria sordida]|uniref:Uncharacterized protein n=1 Tax=Rotaria sordida TaxID=392033 RepID=A0A820BKL7_9BILA|nr:unnamed protein product [Rotaria sordida]
MTSANITCQILVLGSTGSGRTTLIKTILEFIRNDLLSIHAIWLWLHYQLDIDENLLNQLKMLPHMKYFNDTNQKYFPDYFQNNQILMIKRGCLMKWKIEQ